MKKTFSLKSFSLAAAGMIAVSVFMTSCLKNSHDDQQQVNTAALMVVNLAPDKSDVGVAVGGNSLFNTPLAYTNFTGGYLGIYPGGRSVESFNYYSGAAIASTNFNFEAGKYYSAFVVGNAGTYQNVVVLDDIDTLKAGSGQAYIRYVNAIPDSTRPTVVIASGGTNLVSETAAFTRVSSYVKVAPGAVTIDVNNGAGIDADRTITLEAEKVYTVLLSGVAGSATTPVAIKFIENGTLQNQ